MPPDVPQGADEVVAYQEATLAEVRRVLDQLDFDLRDVLLREEALTHAIDVLDAQAAATRVALESAGATIPDPPDDLDTFAPTMETRQRVAVVPRAGTYEELIALASQRLEELGVRADRDPLIQVLPAAEIEDALDQFARRFGETEWTAADWATVLLAGTVGTLLDVLVVRTPRGSRLLGRPVRGSPLTHWLKGGDIPKQVRNGFLRSLEGKSKAPFDATHDIDTDYVVHGLSPNGHRAMTFGHDPLLGFLFGVRDFMHASGTYIDASGEVLHVTTELPHENLVRAIGKEIAHLLSDFSTTQGIQPPGFTLVKLLPGRSPFRLSGGETGDLWVEVAQRMYLRGYDLRHCFASGIVPGAVTAIIVTTATAEAQLAGRDVVAAKLASMLVLGHAIALSGTLLKTTVLYSMNPLALNWAQLLAMAPVVLAWFRAAGQRERAIRTALDREWAMLAAWGG